MALRRRVSNAYPHHIVRLPSLIARSLSAYQARNDLDLLLCHVSLYYLRALLEITVATRVRFAELGFYLFRFRFFFSYHQHY